MAKVDDEKIRKKRLLYIGIGVVAVVIILTIIIATTRVKPKPKVAEPVKIQTNSTALAEQSWVAKSSAKLNNLQQQVEQLQSLQQQQQQQQNTQKQDLSTMGLVPNVNSTASVNYPPPPPSTPPPSFATSAPPPPSTAVSNTKMQESSRQEDDLIGVVSVSPTNSQNTTKGTLPMPETRQQKNNQTNDQENNNKALQMGYKILPGSFVDAFLLTGADVPTSGNGEVGPIPVVFRVISSAQMPNLYKSDIKSCFMLGQATGSLASERAYIRIDTLSCITKSGKNIVKSMQGYATGDDGKVGLAGVVVSKQGSMLARALISGFLQGVGQAFQQSQTDVSVSPLGSTTSVAPDTNTILRYGIGGGVGQAATKLAEFYMKMANQMFPVIVINAGRTANIVFLKEVDL